MADGPVLALAVDPATAGTLYAGTSYGGVFKTTDGGAAWRAAGLRDDVVTALAIDPTMPTTLYAGTVYGGIFKSVDGATTWRVVNLDSASVNALAVDPHTSSTVYAGTDGGFYQSIDGGDTWNAIETGGFYFVSTLALDPAEPGTIYAGTGGSLCGVHLGRCAGVFASMDAGDLWRAVNTGLPHYSIAGDLPYTDVYTLVLDATAPGTLYAGTSAGVFGITDSRGAWTALNSGLPDADVYALVRGGPANSGTLYAGTSASIFQSINGGSNWTPAGPGLPVDASVFALVAESSAGTLYAGTNHGVFKSVDGAQTWSDAGGDLILPCVGDCGGTERVGISDLMLGVNIVMGAQPVSACPAFANELGSVDVVQLVRGVNNALHGCDD